MTTNPEDIRRPSPYYARRRAREHKEKESQNEHIGKGLNNDKSFIEEE